MSKVAGGTLRSRRAASRALSIAIGVALIAAPQIMRAAPEATSLEVKGMIFVGSRAGVRELVLHSKTARMRPDRQLAELEDVNAVVTEDEAGQRSFTMNCDRVELDIARSDFKADGNVRGETADGQSYSAPWVKYVHERRFELLGNVRVEQHP